MVRISYESRMVRTPVYHIPIGEAVISPDGHYSLRIKRAKSNEIEEVPLDELLSLVVSKAKEK